MHYANRGACRGCALKVQCTSNSYRRIGRYADEAVLDCMAERLADRPGVLHRRRESAEHPFGSIKHWMGHGGFLMRRLENVRGEFSLTALAYNIRRAATLVGIPDLQDFEKEPFGSSLVPTLGHQDVENITVLINSSPQVDLPSVDLQEQLIHVPDVAQSASLLSD